MTQIIGRRFAIILNGDPSEHHVENAQMAKESLTNEGYSVSDISTSQGFLDAIKALPKDIGEKDEVVIYTTGHGKMIGDTACIKTSDGALRQNVFNDAVKKLSNAKVDTTVVMDQCYSGSFAPVLSEYTDVRFIGVSIKDMTDSCRPFAEKFWRAAPTADKNADGRIDWQERYSFAMASSLEYSLSTYFDDTGADESKKFETKVIKVHDQDELDAALSKLDNGQYAVVMYSAPWCGPCKTYKPLFEKAADGSFMMIEICEDDILEKFEAAGQGVPAFYVYGKNLPKVGIKIDLPADGSLHQSVSMATCGKDIKGMLINMGSIELPGFNKLMVDIGLQGEFNPNAIELLEELLNSGNDNVTRKAINALALSGKGASAVAPRLLAIFQEKSEFRHEICVALGKIGNDSPEVISTLKRTMAENVDKPLGYFAAASLARLGIIDDNIVVALTNGIEYYMNNCSDERALDGSMNELYEGLFILAGMGYQRALDLFVAVLENEEIPQHRNINGSQWSGYIQPISYALASFNGKNNYQAKLTLISYASGRLKGYLENDKEYADHVANGLIRIMNIDERFLFGISTVLCDMGYNSPAFIEALKEGRGKYEYETSTYASGAALVKLGSEDERAVNDVLAGMNDRTSDKGYINPNIVQAIYDAIIILAGKGNKKALDAFVSLANEGRIKNVAHISNGINNSSIHDEMLHAHLRNISDQLRAMVADEMISSPKNKNIAQLKKAIKKLGVK